VHFVERFFGKGYEERLLASVARKPTLHTTWMLNRVINGLKDPGARMRFVNALQSVLTSPGADPATQKLAAQFLERLSSE